MRRCGSTLDTRDVTPSHRRSLILWRFAEALSNPEDSATLNTSFVERMNLTIRQGLAYLSRRTLAHARSEETLDAHLELLRCHYNFIRPHGAGFNPLDAVTIAAVAHKHTPIFFTPFDIVCFLLFSYFFRVQ